MRNAKIRRKHAQAERLWVRFMTQPQRLIIPDYREVNRKALQEAQEWVISPGQVRHLAKVAEQGRNTPPATYGNPQAFMLYS